MIEANFRPDRATATIQSLLNQYGYDAIQIHCMSEEEILIQRFRRRWESGKRHPGHVDDTTYDHIRESVRQQVNGPLALNVPILEVDTTDWDQVDPEMIIAWVGNKSRLARTA